jgi:hypothetical protein
MTSGWRSVDGRRLLRIAVIVVCAALLVFVVRVPMRFDASGVKKLVLNGGALTLTHGGDPSLVARVPLAFAPFLLVRRTGELLELGGVDDTDPRILLVGLFPPLDVSALASSTSWELRSDEVEHVTLSGATFVADRYQSDVLAVLALSGNADLRAVDVGTLALFAQPGATILASGSAERLSVMDSDGEIDVETLEYGSSDPEIITEMIEHQ